jgi:hypothetical protein
VKWFTVTSRHELGEKLHTHTFTGWEVTTVKVVEIVKSLQSLISQTVSSGNKTEKIE